MVRVSLSRYCVDGIVCLTRIHCPAYTHVRAKSRSFYPLDHMARVKDRLIFETKKMDAVAQRRTSKEQKLRSKESVTNKLLEKSRRKKDHFQAVEEWAASAAATRGRSDQKKNVDDKDYLEAMMKNNNKKKREHADQKHGFGGKKGRFKQNDRKSMNDLSGFNPKGNFASGKKRSAQSSGGGKSKGSGGGAGANRKGKRARDSSRSTTR
jgi:rRNA-processing protein EBP2